MNTPLDRLGVETLPEGPDRCVAAIPGPGLLNPLTGFATAAPVAMLVDGIERTGHRTDAERAGGASARDPMCR